MKFTKKQLEKKASKYTLAEIGTITGMTRQGVHYWFNKFGIKKPTPVKKAIVKTCTTCSDSFIVITKVNRDICVRCKRRALARRK